MLAPHPDVGLAALSAPQAAPRAATSAIVMSLSMFSVSMLKAERNVRDRPRARMGKYGPLARVDSHSRRRRLNQRPAGAAGAFFCVRDSGLGDLDRGGREPSTQ